MTDTTPDMIRRHHAEMELVKARHAVEVTRLREALEMMYASRRLIGSPAWLEGERLADAALTLPAPDVSQIEKDHRAMEAVRKFKHITLSHYKIESGKKVWFAVDDYNRKSSNENDPADAILALEGK